MPPPAISVIVPVYNAARFIAGAVDCIRAQIPSQLILIDDASNDAGLTGATLAALHAAGRIDHLMTLPENLGAAGARNAGLRLATGTYIAFLDVDDRWPAEHLARLLACLQAAPDAGFVLCQVQCQRETAVAGSFADFGAPGVLPSPAAGLFRQETFARVGAFDTALRQGEDLDWFLRAREAGIGYVTTEQTALRYRLHGANISRQRTPARLALVRALHRSLQRRARTP